jgi:hypothetical protein
LASDPKTALNFKNMTNVQETIETTKFQISYYGERINGTHVNFTKDGQEHDMILRGKFNMKLSQLEEALEELTPVELAKCKVLTVDQFDKNRQEFADQLREDGEYSEFEADHILQEELS